MVGLDPVTHVLEAIAGAFFLGSLFAAANSLNFLRRSDVAQGTIVGAQDLGQDGGYAPIFEFLHGGRAYRASGNLGVSEKSIVVGQRVRVRFRVDRPEKAKIDRIWQIFTAAISLAIVGLVFAALAAGVAYVDTQG